MRIIWLSLFSLFVSLELSAQKINLKLNLLKGNTYYHSITGATKITEIIDDKEFNIEATIGCKTSFDIVDIKDTVYTVAVKYKSLTMKMKVQEKTYEFSSDAANKDDKVSKLLAEFIDKPFSVEMSTKGVLTKFGNIDTIIANMINQFPEINIAQKQKVSQQLVNAYGEKAFEGSFNMLTAMFPATKVAKGDKWVVTTKLESGMAATLVTTYQLIDIGDSFYEIHGQSEMKTADKDAYKEVNGMPARYDLAGPMETSLKISKVTGWIMEGKITQTMKGNVEITDNSDSSKIVIPMSYFGDITVSGN